MRKIVFRYGLLGGLVVGAVLLSSMGYCYATGRFESSMLLGYASMILAFSMIFVAVKTIRDKHYGGMISFGKAFKTGLLVALVTSTVYVVVWLICYYVFIPDFMQQYSDYIIQKSKTNGLTAAEQAEKVATVQQYSKLYKNPLFVILFTYLEILPVGVLVSLIVALILKRKQGKGLAIAA